MGIEEKVASVAGEALAGIRAGEEKLALHADGLAAPRTIDLESPAFAPGGAIPPRYSADGEGRPPPLRWSKVPDETRELVLLCEDPDAPKPGPFVHWALYRIPPDAREIAEGRPLGGAREGKNSTLRDGWTPPSPPPLHGVHHYHFELFALDAPLSLDDHAGRSAIVQAMRGHVLACADLVGTYQRA